MTTTHPILGTPTASAKCPGCGETFYALPGFDPLKIHIQYCEVIAAEEEAERAAECSCGDPDCGAC